MALQTRLPLLIALISLIGLTPLIAYSETLARRLSKSGIKPEDVTLMQENASLLYTAQTKSIGDVREWTNPKTGTTGTVRIADLKDNCVQLSHQVLMVRPQKEVRSTVWRCLTASGDWQLTAEP